jgi:PKD repeat protein
VTCTASDAAGNSATGGFNVTVYDNRPVAKVTSIVDDFARGSSVRCGQSIVFDGTGSYQGRADRAIIGYHWTFGDGTTATSQAPTHTYAAGGTYQVTLTATDNAGQSASVTHGVLAVDQPPVARFTYSCTKTVCTFDGRSSTDDRGIVSYAWSLGNRTGTVTGAVVTTDYKKAGSYTVTLTVSDGVGQTNSVTQTITVTQAR